MADFSKICQESLESVKQFLEEANANTPEVNQRLERLNEVALILSSSIQDEEVKVNQKWLESMRNLCKRLLFGGWTKLIMTMACHSSFLNGVETQQRADETIKLPSHMQKKVDEITKYSKRCQEILERTDEIVHSLIEKVCKAKNDNFEGIADKDIRTLQTALENLEGDLEASEIYLKSSREAFNELKSDIDAEKKWNDKVKVVTIAAGCLAIAITIGGVVLHVSLPIASQMGAVQKFNELLVPPFGLAVVTGTASFLVWIKSVSGRQYFPKLHFVLKEKSYWNLLTVFHNYSQLMQERDRVLLRIEKLAKESL